MHDITEDEMLVHKRHNRVLQFNFATRDADSILQDGHNAGESWLTDCICPSAEAALIMHLSKEMVVRYRVPEDEIGQVAEQAYDHLCELEVDLIKKLKHTIDERFEQLKSDPEFSKNIKETARKRLEGNQKYLASKGKHIDIDDPKVIESAERIVLDLERKKITDKAIDQYIQSKRELIEHALELERKESLSKGQNKDYVFQGAAGSGKSTISRQFLDEEAKTNYITLATDNYRGVAVPGTNYHEDPVKTKDVFARTQDMAYMVKELVHAEVGSIVDKGSRPNIICDCITMDGFMHGLLKDSKEVKSVVAAYAGDSGIGIAERAERRAMNEKAAPADKGRFVNTTSLFGGHAYASSGLVSAVPQGTVTELFSTDIEFGDKPPKIAEVDPEKSKIRIYDLRLASRFFNKKNMNVDAKSPIELAVGKGGDSLSFAKKAESVLDLVQNDHRGKTYGMELFENADSKEKYASIVRGEKGDLEVRVHDKETFKRITLDQASIQGAVLRSAVRQVAYGGMEEALDKKHGGRERGFEGDIASFKAAYKLIKPKERIESSKISPDLIEKVKALGAHAALRAATTKRGDKAPGPQGKENRGLNQ